MKYYLTTPISKERLALLKSGDEVFLSGVIYTARDAAHARLTTLIKKNEVLPFDVKNQAIYYVGPTPTPPGGIIGSCGPTSSYRMDAYSPLLMEKGLLTMIGKGSRSNEFVKELVNYGGVYLECIGGSAALIATKVKKMDMIAYPDLGAEAIYRLEVKDFPTLVSVDSRGHDLSKREISKYRNKLKIKEGKL